MGKGNIDNLKTPSTDEARRRGQKGGLASGKSRQNRRMLQEAFQKLLVGKYTLEDGGKQLGGYDALASTMIKAALDGSVKAFVAIRDTIGEKPKEMVEVESNDLTGIKIKFVDKSNRRQAKEKDPKIVGDYTPPTNTEDE